MIYKCKACDRVYCRDHLEKRDHVCKTLPPPPNKHTGKDAVSLFRANLKKKLGAFGSTKQSGGTATNPIVLDNDSTSKRNKGGPKPVPRAATDAGVERIVIHKKSVMGNLNLSKSQQCLLAVEAQVEPKEPEAKKDPDAHGIAEPFSATKKKVVKAYTMKASFKDDWVMGKVRDESLKLLGLEENKYTDSQEDQWGIMFQDKDRGRIIIPDEKLRDVTAECPGMTLIIKKGYLIKREDLKGH